MLLSTTADAYIGPGAGAATFAVVLGILASIVMAFFAILWYPIKRYVRKRKSMKLEDQKTENDINDFQEDL